MSVVIVGIKRTLSSKNKEVMYHNYYYEEPFSDYDKEHAEHLEGRSCGVEFSTKDIGCKVGDEVEFQYQKGFQDKAVLSGCRIIKPQPEAIGKK